jgi:hypothetical protein
MTDLEKFEEMCKELDADMPHPLEEKMLSMDRMTANYSETLKKFEGRRLDLAKWIPSFRGTVRPLIPGDFMVILADTGQGKTAVLQNIAYCAAPPLPTVFFEIELSNDLMFERMTALHSKRTQAEVESAVKSGWKPDFGNDFNHISFVPESSISVDGIREFVKYQNSILSEPVSVVILDYIGLIKGEGKTRYERFSNIPEDLKRLAKELDVVMIAASQVHRPEGCDSAMRPGLHSGKDSGSIENSAGLLIGLFREGPGGSVLKMDILKNTRGLAGITIEAAFDASRMIVRDPLFPTHVKK